MNFLLLSAGGDYITKIYLWDYMFDLGGRALWGFISLYMINFHYLRCTFMNTIPKYFIW